MFKPPEGDQELNEILDEEIDNAYQGLTDKEIEQEFKRFEAMNKSKNITQEEENFLEILRGLNRLQRTAHNIQDDISDERREHIKTLIAVINCFNNIKEVQGKMLNKINKWFIGILVMCFVFAFGLGVITYANRDIVVPNVKKVWEMWNTTAKVKSNLD